MTLAVDVQLYAEPYTPPPVVLYEFQPRPNEQGQPDPRKTAEEVGSAPDVLKLSNVGGVVFTQAWQNYLRAINPNMTPNQIDALMKSDRWGFNKTGLPEHNPPYTDKDRTFAYNIHAGVEYGDNLILDTFDGHLPPPPLSVISPQTHPWRYLVLTYVVRGGGIRGWDQAAHVDGYAKDVTLFPLVSNIEIWYPMAHVRRVSAWRMPY